MSILEHHIHDNAEILPEPEAPQAGESVLDHLARKRRELAGRETRQVTKLIPGWDGALAVRYRYPDGGADVIIAAVQRAQASSKPEAIRNANTDILVACCHEIVGRKPGGEWERLDPENPSPVRFTARLAGLLGIDVPDGIKSPARFICRSVFSPQAHETGVYEGDIALSTQAGALVNWLNGGEQAGDEALEGE